MNKTKIILISIGGVAVLGALVLGYFIYDAWSTKSESEEELDYLNSEASRLTRMAVYPCQEGVAATEANRKAYDEWREATTELASVGDLKFDETTPASFKAFINDEAKRFQEKPGSINEHFVKSDFGFGFDEYINKSALPAAADLPRLQREWHDVSLFLDLLADSKATGVSALAMVRAPVEAEDASKKSRGKKSAKAKDDEAKQPDVTRFEVVFSAGPEALVNVLNAIATNPRFLVAESMTFLRTPDELAERLGEKAQKAAESTGRRRRRGAQVEETAAAEGEQLTGIVTDPAKIGDFKVTMKIAVYDFRTKLEGQEKKEEAK